MTFYFQARLIYLGEYLRILVGVPGGQGGLLLLHITLRDFLREIPDLGTAASLCPYNRPYHTSLVLTFGLKYVIISVLRKDTILSVQITEVDY